MKQILFFALRDDILRVLEHVEAAHSIQYIETGFVRSPQLIITHHASELVDLGQADSDSAIGCRSYLVAEAGAVIQLREIPATQQYAIDQLANHHTVVLTPGGLRGQRILLNGRVATAWETSTSKVLMKVFRHFIGRLFTRIGTYWVGPKAAALLHAGGRLTIAVQSPYDYDLVDP